MNELPLRDIHLPDGISWWPLALGWWLLLALFLGMVAYLLWPTQRKLVLKMLKRIERDFKKTGDAKQCVTELSLLLRWAVVKKELNSAGLIGEKWLCCLDRQLNTSEFSKGVGKMLLTAPYQKDVGCEKIAELIALSRKWGKKL